MKTIKVALTTVFTCCLTSVLLIGITGCVKRFPRLETEPSPKALEGTWINDKMVSTSQVDGEFTIILSSDNIAHIVNFPLPMPSKTNRDYDIRFVNGESQWKIHRDGKYYNLWLDKPNTNEPVALYVERDSNEILLTYYINPNWPIGIVFRREAKRPEGVFCQLK